LVSDKLETASLPRKLERGCLVGVCMKLIHVWYAAIGFAVARLLFNRTAVPVTDPIARLRNSGLL